jgi:hypothetical protein
MSIELKKPRDLNDLIRKHNWNTEAIREIVQNAVANNPISLFTVPTVVRYLTADMQRNWALQIIQWRDQNWLRYVQQMREFLQDEDIRLAALAIYRQSPWFFYNHSDILKQIFPNEWFKKKVNEEGLDLRKSELWNMFLLFNGHSLPESFGPPIDEFIQSSINDVWEVDVGLLWTKEPGFACGGMEKNFLEAAKTGMGICVINESFYAKYYHRKWDPAKVTYLPKETYRTNNWYIIWEDYFYSPSNWQHWITIEAIKAGERSITINDLALKAVRPTIWLKTAEITRIIGN